MALTAKKVQKIAFAVIAAAVVAAAVTLALVKTNIITNKTAKMVTYVVPAAVLALGIVTATEAGRRRRRKSSQGSQGQQQSTTQK